ncbi:MAG: VIT1/CCC1 transporter family protein [Verrucomicrobiota bacterium]
MQGTVHAEQHFTASEAVRDVVIGMADGLTVPFALAAGLSGAVHSTAVIVVAGLAEIAAGSIAMGLGGYLAARTDREHYASEKAREYREIRAMPAAEKEEVAAVFREYGLDDGKAEPVVEAICADPDRWVDFMMRYELGLEAPDPGRATKSALTIGLSYVAGGLVPLLPYMVTGEVLPGLAISAVVTLLALFSFGAVKGRLTGVQPLRSGLQTVTIGGIAAAAAFGIARWIG